jgi:hypothetical protein
VLSMAAPHLFVLSTDASPLLTTLLPAVIGTVLGFGGSLLIRRGEHQWQEQRESGAQAWHAEQQRLAHEREVVWQEQRDQMARALQIARPLDDALVKVQEIVLKQSDHDWISRWTLAYEEWQQGWVRHAPFLTDEELDARYEAVGTILLELHDRADDPDAKRATLASIAMRAIGNARIALAYFLRGRPLPPASFPTRTETVELLEQGDPRPLATEAPLRRWLAQHKAPPWR